MTEAMLGDEVPEDDGFTELRDARFSRVDLVGKGANGLPFLIAKSADGGLLPPDLVRQLISEDGPAVPVSKEDPVTISGSPAAVMKMIHEAAQRAPLSTTTAEGGPMNEDVQKADAPVEVADIVPENGGGTTEDSVPGSPDWEAKDAEAAESAIGVLGRARAAVDWLAGREAQEAVVGDDGDAGGNCWDLEDACSAIDYAIRTLGAFVAGEKLEADGIGDEIDAVTKAAADVAAPLGVLEALVPVVKAGRVLSAANEARIKSASDSLAQVLASLPAPIADDQPVAKEQEDAVDETTIAAGLAEVAKAGADADAAAEVLRTAAAGAATVTKAKGDPQMAVFDSNGKLVGTIDPGDLSPIAETAPPAGGDTEGDDAEAAEVPDDAATAQATTEPPAPVAEGDLAPAAPAAAGTPADATEDQAVVAKSDDEVLKEIIDARVAALLEDERERIVKEAETRAIARLEAPAPPRVMSNGQVPPAHLLRGQDEAPAPLVDVAKAEEMRDRLNAATSMSEREAIQKEMNEQASSVYDTLRAQAQGQRRRR